MRRRVCWPTDAPKRADNCFGRSVRISFVRRTTCRTCAGRSRHGTVVRPRSRPGGRVPLWLLRHLPTSLSRTALSAFDAVTCLAPPGAANVHSLQLRGSSLCPSEGGYDPARRFLTDLSFALDHLLLCNRYRWRMLPCLARSQSYLVKGSLRSRLQAVSSISIHAEEENIWRMFRPSSLYGLVDHGFEHLSQSSRAAVQTAVYEQRLS